MASFVKAAGQFLGIYGLIALAVAAYLGASIHEESATGMRLQGLRMWQSLVAGIAILGVACFVAGLGFRGLRAWAFRWGYLAIVDVCVVFALVAIRGWGLVSGRERVADLLFTALATSPMGIVFGFLLVGGAKDTLSPGQRAIASRATETDGVTEVPRGGDRIDPLRRRGPGRPLLAGGDGACASLISIPAPSKS